MLNEIQQERRKKLQKIREMGIDPYGWRYDTARPIAETLAGYIDGTDDAPADIAGRLVLQRDMGKLIFAQLRDESGTMQIALSRKQLDEQSWALAKLLDLGDVIAVAGTLTRTRTGEITVFANKLTLLTKSLLPLPEKFHGLQDTELRYRQRYLDLIVNPESMEVFRRRAAIISHFRRTLEDQGFLEVETPMMQSICGGAAAKPFITHHNALDVDLYMRISPELFLKRLLVGGMDKVFEINRNFRNEGIDTTHNPEFTMMELYQARADYKVMMELTEQLISTAAQAICGSTTLPYGELELNFAAPWRRARYADLLAEHAGVAMDDVEGAKAKARELHIDPAGKAHAVLVNEVFEHCVEPHLVQPTFVIDYPAEICPLTRRSPEDPSIALRFEAFAANMELANAYTELNDPDVQEANFSSQLDGEDADETMRVMDEDFITALQHGMPPAGGLGIGIDRVVMLLTNRASIRDVVLFPTLRPQKNQPKAE